MSTVDLYLRKSNKDAGRSVERQLEELTEAAPDSGLTVGRVFVDPDFSASRYRRRERPNYGALVEHIQTGACEVLGLYEANRGSRDLTEWSAFLDLCRKRSVRIWISEHCRVYDLSRRADWRALANEGLAAADFSEALSEVVLSGKRKAARNGTPAGRLPYGFTREYDDKGKLVRQYAHPEQAPVVREIINRIAAGKDSLRTIAADLNRRGVTAPLDGLWSSTGVRQLALNPSYAGQRVHQGQIVGKAAWKPIVDPERWETAAALLRTPSRAANTSTTLTHWLSGAVLCGVCQRPLASGSKSGGSWSVYRCKRQGCLAITVSAPGMEAFVESMIVARLARPDALEAFRPRANRAELATAEDAVRTLRERLEAHYAEAAAGRLSAAGLSAMEGHLLPEIERAEEKARRLRVPPTVVDLAGVNVAARWHRLDAKQRRGVVQALAELVCAPATRRGRLFDESRMYRSRWIGDSRTWGEIIA